MEVNASCGFEEELLLVSKGLSIIWPTKNNFKKFAISKAGAKSETRNDFLEKTSTK